MVYNLELKVFPELRNLSSDGQSNVVFDVSSCHLFEVDDVVLAVLMALAEGVDDVEVSELLAPKFDKSAVDSALAGIAELIVNGVIRQKSRMDPSARVGQKSYLSYVVLNVSHECQLACKYCFAHGGDYGIDDSDRIMSTEVARAAIELVNETRGNGPANITFFGGEPLLNWDVIRDSIEFAEKTCLDADGKPSVVFAITTNAIAMTPERAQYLREHNVSIMLSIDGDKETHNLLRPCKNPNEDSWESVVEGLRHCLDAGLAPMARATISSMEIDLVKLADEFKSLGFTTLNMQPVERDPGDPLALTHSDILEYEAQTVRLMERGTSECYELRQLYPNIMAANKQHLFCGMGITGISVAPNGDIYPCHRLVGVPEFHIGSVYGGVDTLKAESWLIRHTVDNSMECRGCFMRYICRGGCYAENYYANSDLYVPYATRCHLTQHAFHRTIEHILLERKQEQVAETE